MKRLTVSRVYSEDEARNKAETCMCMWEWVCDVLRDYYTALALDPEYESASSVTNDLVLCKEQLGMAGLRIRMFEMADTLVEEYEKAVAEDYEDCFDWEYVPWFMARRVVWPEATIYPGGPYNPNNDRQ